MLPATFEVSVVIRTQLFPPRIHIRNTPDFAGMTVMNQSIRAWCKSEPKCGLAGTGDQAIAKHPHMR
jgi:hypothetical protein